MDLRSMQWGTHGEQTQANAEAVVRIGWRDGREVEQRVGVEMELVRVEGRTLIARLSQQARN
jgi:hypothetical protein